LIKIYSRERIYRCNIRNTDNNNLLCAIVDRWSSEWRGNLSVNNDCSEIWIVRYSKYFIPPTLLVRCWRYYIFRLFLRFCVCVHSS